ncbi:SDR family NAD(P)-dependent oxidoreductase [Granulicella paludicola]|jgi:NAD(P)-dependent dehydrogenase (short-subunit alcohol dehydrogenase family)|uniref:SDR family NAD(P)-dependent oxidoreductase n=1 Tax=Granulicella paludicola TaxID=474951 RepID=UPI0021E061D9|nr:SDR family NAD(P)-dependent oxidoreductase [Granulicella paludicola]
MTPSNPSAPSPFATYPSLRDRTVLVTGGASGIGASLVEAFAEQGSRVAFFDLQQQAGEALVERLSSSAPHAPRFFSCDVTDLSATRQAIATIEQDLGDIEVLVNNAGNDTRHRLDEVTPELWDSLMAVNLKQQFFLCQGVLPGMRRLGRGSIINLSSIAWLIPSTGVPVYATAKAAIVGMTRTLAHELGPENIRVNAVLPGAIQTERQQRLWLTEAYTAEVLSRQALKRLILPDEVARLVLFLAADDSAAITNQSYVIDGGFV